MLTTKQLDEQMQKTKRMLTARMPLIWNLSQITNSSNHAQMGFGGLQTCSPIKPTPVRLIIRIFIRLIMSSTGDRERSSSHFPPGRTARNQCRFEMLNTAPNTQHHPTTFYQHHEDITVQMPKISTYQLLFASPSSCFSTLVFGFEKVLSRNST